MTSTHSTYLTFTDKSVLVSDGPALRAMDVQRINARDGFLAERVER